VALNQELFMTGRGTIRTWAICGGLAVGFAVSAALARPGIVKLDNGTTYEGDVTPDPKDPNALIVNVHGIASRIARNQIASVQYTQDFASTFHERLSKLAPEDVKGRLALSREAFNNRDYKLAREAAESAREADPNSAEAVAMLNTIQGQMRLVESKTRPSMTSAPAGATQPVPPSPPGAGVGPGDQKVLKPAEINAIRQAELRPEDTGIRYRFNRDVVRRFERYENIQPSEWASMTPNQQIHEIITHGTPEMRRDVEILNDPPALFQYRRNVQQFVIQNCATMNCHAAPNAQKFQLVVPADSDAATYTNFYILSRYVKQRKVSASQASNPFAQSDLRMIDRQKPRDSLLLQYALPGSLADYPHPDVPGYKPAFHSVNDPRYRTILNWIGNTLQPVQPDYGFEFTPSGPAIEQRPAATQPASTQPAQ
jgi:hypothetical protein